MPLKKHMLRISLVLAMIAINLVLYVDAHGLGKAESSFSALFLGCTLAMLPLALLTTFYNPDEKQFLNIFALFCGVALGVMLNAFTDFGNDRNLFPIEMAIFTLLSAPAIITGAAAGIITRRVVRRTGT
ncbi:hypothetical protein [Undibacterium pigrum]|uniref:Uncharacterized protein n=1 Tax=Undibacterium pigrum TaxID=401470 RepID=A0A318IRG0_9BURK|nr:hypothetical protein [Undibacterium pigrum]PXX37754.1 hypothetical protein DFR42_1154 [Undibacterium pigrum]